MKRSLCFLLLGLLLLAGCEPEEQQTDAKPVIYLYPPTETEVSVRLHYDGQLTCTYPAYRQGLHVTAQPDGTLTDDQGNQYSYLFWEGENQAVYDFSQGFVVPGRETADFLRQALSQLGLTPREYNEFIVYWLPRMEGNPYNLISFQQEAYTDTARLEITPEPDSLLRVFMAYQPLDRPAEVEPQVLEPFVRQGFTVVEWGGCEIKG